MFSLVGRTISFSSMQRNIKVFSSMQRYIFSLVHREIYFSMSLVCREIFSLVCREISDTSAADFPRGQTHILHCAESRRGCCSVSHSGHIGLRLLQYIEAILSTCEGFSTQVWWSIRVCTQSGLLKPFIITHMCCTIEPQCQSANTESDTCDSNVCNIFHLY